MLQAFGGSFKGFLNEFQRRHHGQGSALDLVKMVTETFPCFQDETYYEGRKGKNATSLSTTGVLTVNSISLETRPNSRR